MLNNEHIFAFLRHIGKNKKIWVNAIFSKKNIHLHRENMTMWKCRFTGSACIEDKKN